jgi:F-type H+-transporting ATPase subunit b
MIANILIAAAGEVSAHAVEAAGNPITTIAREFHVEWPLLIAQIFNFCIVAFVLYKFAFKPILETIDERQKKIAEGLQYAEEMKEKLAAAEKKEAETLKQAQLDAQKIVTETRESAKAMFEKQTQEASAKAEDILKKAEEAIEQERVRMLSEVRREIARLVVQTTAKVLRKDLSESERAAYSESASRELTSIES